MIILCLRKRNCFASNYTALFSDEPYVYQPETTSTYAGRGILPNGVSFLFWSSGSGISIKVDVNGPEKPNKAGVDFFSFGINSTRGVVGSFAKVAGTYGEICQYNNPSQYNGALCSGYVLKYGNMDYRRRDVSND